MVIILQEQVDRLHGQSPLSPATLDKAFNTGTYKDFPGLFEGMQVPTQGWWELVLTETHLKLSIIFYLQMAR